MPDTHYLHPRLAALYDIECGWSPDRDFYLELGGVPPRRILDLGCGTGLVCDAYAARGHVVTGLDPAPAMLDIARQKPHGSRIEWVAGAAERYRSAIPFDLVIMTGHAFQVLLDDADSRAAFASMRENLAPGGQIVFESRNPALDWAAKWDGASATIETPEGLVHKTTRVFGVAGDRLTFEQRYHFADEETLASVSTLRFPSREAIEAQLTAVGLTAKAVLGNWHGGAFDAATSEEMIFIAG